MPVKDPVLCSCGCGGEIPPRHLFRYREPYLLRGHSLPAPACACGCGEPINRTSNTRYHSIKFLPGHHNKTANDVPAPCACGCGGLTTVRRGKALTYITGHNQRGKRRPDLGTGRYVNHYGYVLIRKPEHPRAYSMGGYVMEHRWLMEQHIGRYLTPDEHVHHLNHDRSDNRLENLMIVDPVEHAKYHTSQVRRPQSEEHRRKASESMKRVWAERKRKQHD